MKAMMLTSVVLATALSLGAVEETRADVRVAVGIRIGPDHPDYRYYRGTFRYGFDRGFDEGLREGERDARRHERFEFRDEGRFRDADRGYKGWMGPRFQYERGYRSGFADGYARAYRRFARYDRYDGYDRGRHDGRRDGDRRGW